MPNGAGGTALVGVELLARVLATRTCGAFGNPGGEVMCLLSQPGGAYQLRSKYILAGEMNSYALNPSVSKKTSQSHRLTQTNILLATMW